MSFVDEEMQFCPICFQTFDFEKLLPIVFSCGHSICIVCNENPENIMEKCQTCREPIISRVRNSSLIDALKTLEIMCTQVGESTNQKMKIQCSNCQKWICDKNMHICKDCVIHLLDSSDKSPEEITKNIVKTAMCSDCTVPMHSYKGHKTLSIIPIWKKYNFLVESSKMKPKLAIFNGTSQWSEQLMSSFQDLSIQFSKYHKLLIEMAKNSDCSEKQNDVFENVEKFIDEATSIYLKAEYEIKHRGIDSQSEFNLSSKNSPNLEKLEEACEMLYQTFSALGGPPIEVHREYYKLTEMARKSETIEKQNELFEQMEDLLVKQIDTHREIQYIMVKHEIMLEECLRNMEEFHDKCKVEHSQIKV